MDKLIAKICYKFQLESLSPISIGSSYNENTDHDILIHSETLKPYIPATSIAGCYFGKIGELREFFGIYDKNPVQSPLFISDGIFTNISSLVIRDNNAIDNDKKITKQGAKFDSEAIDAGSSWEFHIEYTIRESNKNNLYVVNSNIIKIASYINSGEFRIGYKQKVGFGKCIIKKLDRYCFTNENIGFECRPLIDYCDMKYDDSGMDITKYLETVKTNSYILECACQIVGGLSIKSYVADANSHLDYETLTSDSKSIISGSSLKGALSAAVYKILRQLGFSGVSNNAEFEKFATQFRMHKNSKNNNKVMLGASYLTIEESFIEGGISLEQTRTAVNRFSGGSLEGSLYTERVNIGGSTKLKLIFKEDTPLWIIGLYYFALLDVSKGYQSIGGQTSIGRGILSGNITCNFDVDACKKCLIDFLKKDGGINENN